MGLGWVVRFWVLLVLSCFEAEFWPSVGGVSEGRGARGRGLGFLVRVEVCWTRGDLFLFLGDSVVAVLTKSYLFRPPRPLDVEGADMTATTTIV